MGGWVVVASSAGENSALRCFSNMNATHSNVREARPLLWNFPYFCRGGTFHLIMLSGFSASSEKSALPCEVSHYTVALWGFSSILPLHDALLWFSKSFVWPPSHLACECHTLVLLVASLAAHEQHFLSGSCETVSSRVSLQLRPCGNLCLPLATCPGFRWKLYGNTEFGVSLFVPDTELGVS